MHDGDSELSQEDIGPMESEVFGIVRQSGPKVSVFEMGLECPNSQAAIVQVGSQQVGLSKQRLV
jgi:hypothetical protein